MSSVSMKRAMSIAALGALTCSVPAHALNYAATGVVTKVFNYTVRHSNQFANGVTMIQLSTPLEGGCIWTFPGRHGQERPGYLARREGLRL